MGGRQYDGLYNFLKDLRLFPMNEYEKKILSEERLGKVLPKY